MDILDDMVITFSRHHINKALSINISNENFTSAEVHPSANLTTNEDLILHGFRTGLLCFNVVFGVPTHSYGLWLITRGRRIPSEFFIVNLTVCELMYSLIIIFFYISQRFRSLDVLLQHFFQGLTVTGRPRFQCLMCVERYMAVVHPVTFLKYKPLRYRVICCSVVWIITLGSCVVESWISMFTLLLNDIKAFTQFISIQFLPFLCIQLFFLVAVFRALKQSGPGERGRERKEENCMKRTVFYLILITTVTLVVMFVPFIFTGFLTFLILKKHDELSLISFFSLCCFILTGFVQPVLYLHRVGKLFSRCSFIKGCYRKKH